MMVMGLVNSWLVLKPRDLPVKAARISTFLKSKTLRKLSECFPYLVKIGGFRFRAGSEVMNMVS